MNRWSLIADPAGGGLYWVEDLPTRDFDGEVHRYTRLVRFDLATRRQEVVRDAVGAPLVVMRGKLVGLRLVDHDSIVTIDRDTGSLQLLTPDDFDVVDFAAINEHELVLLADGVGPRAAFTLDLDRPRPKYLADADRLLDAWGDHVFLVAKDEGVAIDLKTGARTSFKATKHTAPVGNEQLEVEGSLVRAHNMIDGSVRDVISVRGDWRLNYAPGAILARTPPIEDRSDAVVVTPGGTRWLPTVLGGTTIVGVAQIGAQTWALIAHNTSNYLGDLTENHYEADVCLLPNGGSIRFATRRVPKRYDASSEQLFANVERLIPTAGLQFFDGDGDSNTLQVHIKQRAPSDVGVMRERVREVANRITSTFGDREIRTSVRWLDEQVAIVRWRRDRLRERTSAGMGDALLTDPTEFDIELRDRKVSMEKGKVRCSGTLVSSQPKKLTGLSVQCVWGDRVRTIAVPDLDTKGTYTFDQSYDVDEDAGPHLEVYRDGEPLEVYDVRREATMRQVLDVAKLVYAESGFALESHSIKKQLEVTGEVVPTFESLPEDKQLTIAKEVYDRYGALRAIYATADDTPLLIRIHVQTRPATYEYDGEQLKRVD